MSTAAPSSPDLFSPSFGLRSAHAQTILSSSINPLLMANRRRAFGAQGEDRVLTAADGVRLHAVLHEREGSPLVVLLHGWLGGADSVYMLSVAGKLERAGYAVARLNLRDHGGSEHLNEEMFHSARIAEVVDVVNQLTRGRAQSECALLGFSLGGNFALRVAARTGLYAIACCPVIDPAVAMPSIDDSPIYRRFFVRKWQRSLNSKAAAHPDRYDFSPARGLSTVSALTDYFVANHTEYPSSPAYFDAYSVAGDRLREAHATIIAAADDPVIPASSFVGLPDHLDLVLTDRGGHCGYLANWRFESWFDAKALDRLRSHFARDTRHSAAG